MRLKCEVQVSNRLLPCLNLRKPGRSTFTQVSIGCKPGNETKNSQVFIMLCTAQNRNGTRYFLHKNVEQIFSRFVNEGKATIRLTSPAEDIAFSKADPNQLAMLVKLVKMAAEGKVFPEKTLSVLAPASAKQIERPATKLCVECPSQYPMQFPKSLQELKVNNCSLRRVSPQIIALPNLCVLDLSCNSIPDVPNAFGQLVNLHTIDLSNNKLTCFPIVLLKSELRNSLVSINLKHNEIKALPHDMSKLQNVHSLNLNNNLIQCLPESIAFIRSLQNIFMSDNKLGYLPGILLSRTLGTADFSHNLFVDRLRDRGSGLFSVPTLMEWAARVVVNQRIHYTNEDLDVHSISYLKQVHYCLCGKPCFESSISQLHRSKLPSTINYSSEEYPFLVYICSKKCQQRFDKL